MKFLTTLTYNTQKRIGNLKSVLHKENKNITNRKLLRDCINTEDKEGKLLGKIFKTTEEKPCQYNFYTKK